MTTELVKYKDTLSGAEVELSLADIKQLFCPTATDKEAVLFLKLCQYQGLNPFVRDAYLLKFSENRPATMVVGKDSFTKRAEAHPQFAGMVAGVVIQLPHGEKAGGVEYRKGSLILDGEKLVGGWAEVHRLDRKIPTETPVSFNEYTTGQSGWKSMPGTMIRKVALVQALREAFPNTFAGLYDAAEMKVELPDEGEDGTVVISGEDADKTIAVIHNADDRPAGKPNNPSSHFCDEHKVYFEAKTSSKSRKVGWVHKKADDTYCVWDGYTPPIEATAPMVIEHDKATVESLQEVGQNPLEEAPVVAISDEPIN